MKGSKQSVQFMRLFGVLAGCALSHPVAAQAIPDAQVVSSAQVVACKPGSPAQNAVDMCGWGVWGMDTQRSTLIADLKEPATYLICRDGAPAEEASGFPLTVEADGVPIGGGSPASPYTWSGNTCATVTGKKIVLSSPRAPAKPVRGYYIRAGNRVQTNAVTWGISKGGGFPPLDRALLAQLAVVQTHRVCFGDYLRVEGVAHLREHRLLVEGMPAQVRAGEIAVFTYSSCVDVSARSLAIEPLWNTPGVSSTYGRFAF